MEDWFITNTQSLQGLGLGTIHVQKEPALTKKIGVNSLPYLLRVIDGRPIHYKDNQISLRRIIEFTHKLFPYKTIVDANDDTLEEFLNEWPDNKVNALIFSQVEPSRLRYLLLAFQYNTYASFGLVKPDNSKTHKTCRRYRINKKMESLLIFNEITTSPLATLSMGELVPQTMRDVLNANKFLLLPRLSSHLGKIWSYSVNKCGMFMFIFQEKIQSLLMLYHLEKVHHQDQIFMF
ncbi:dnaJ homolog subfamily C member 16-like [Tachypleus tridentatus]|uniref:dnaJ homolog subfamily C member 16-like n=1 Tax=Tachypleus tridentatus TaxID=6853 RepID=UPI003FD2C2B2